jgi:hypothetical protein
MTLGQLPDLAQAAKLLRLSIELEKLSTYPFPSCYQIGIVDAVRNGRTKEVIAELKEVGKANIELLYDIVGDLDDVIMKF